MKRHKYIDTVWQARTYDVWGNAKDGFDVNDIYSHGTHELRLRVDIYNAGTPSEFEGATPTDKQLREVLGIKPRVKLNTDGDDLVIYVNHASTGYPFGEVHCVSHESLSPIRVKTVKE